MDLSSLSQALDVDEVVGAPLRAEVVELPLLEDVEEGQVVALRYEELFPGRVRLFLSVLVFIVAIHTYTCKPKPKQKGKHQLSVFGR